MMEKSLRPASKRRNGAVRQSAYDDFQSALLDGRLRPGQLVSQRELVEMLDLSIGALREVLPRLQAEGLLLVVPQRGIQIPAIDLPMIRDAFQMRLALEREAVMHAAEHMSQEVLDQQYRLHRDILETVSSGPSEERLQKGQAIDDGFHDLLIHATGNELLINAYEINSIRIRLIKLDRIRLNEKTLPAAIGDHLSILDALLKREKHAAAAAMEQHMENARARAMMF